MKYLVAIFLVATALQPMDLQACAMGDDQPPSHHSAMHDGADRDCCNPDGDAPMKDCKDAVHCAFLAFGFLVIPPASDVASTAPQHHYEVPDGEAFSGLFSRPLLRPPSA